MTYDPVRNKIKRAEALAAGLCGLCKKRPLVAGKKFCDVCLQRHRNANEKRDLSKKRVHQLEFMKRRRAEAMAGAVCAHCGVAGKLELDHIDPSQKTDHRIWSWSEPRRLAELAKCQWLCTPCHLKKSIAERGQTEITHGRLSGYKRGCRCGGCREANAESKRRQRKHRKESASSV